MPFRPAPIPQDPKALAAHVDRELNRIANAYADLLETATILLATGVTVRSGAGSPEGVVSARVGSLYLRTDGGATTTLYVKTSGTGNTGWTAK
jgi:hypothetical protein